MRKSDKMNVLSLFDGISCGQIAFNNCNIKINNYYSSEIDQVAIGITKYHFPNTIFLGDINNCLKWNLPKIDLIIGGSPCQNFSIVNNKDRRGLDGLASSLFFKFVECLELFKPKYFLLENVACMSNKDKDIISSILGVKPVLINSSLVSGQNRKRLYWANFKITQPDNKNILFEDIQENLPFRELKPFVFTKYGKRHHYDIMGIINQEKSNPLTTKKGHTQNYYFNEDKTLMRTLSINEYERLQTLEDNYTKYYISNYKILETKESDRYKCVGNGWTVKVIEHIFECLKEVIENEKK